MVIHPISWNTLRYWRFHHAAHQVTPPTTTGWWFQTLWKIWKSVGIIIPNIWKNEIHVPNHQPDINIYIYIYMEYRHILYLYDICMAWIKVINRILTMQIQEWDNVMNEYSIKRIMKVCFFFDGTLIGLRANWRLIWTNTKYSPWVGPNI